MELKYFRKMTNDSGYGEIRIPKSIFDKWTAEEYTHVKMTYDESADSLIITPI